MEPEVIEISADQMPKSKANKGKRHKKVAFHEIIDVDMDEDRNDAGLVEGMAVSGKKRKGFTDISLGPGSSSQSDSNKANSGKKVKSNNKGKEVRVDPGYSFKKFDTVADYSDHHYTQPNSAMYQAMYQPPKNWAKRIQEEWRILEKDLPDTIFVRVYESRMDILRAVIIGAEGTPYHDGLFFFDVFFPSTYPNSPPLVTYRSGGLHINPNLYNTGYVCLSLLNTWPGRANENWVPGTSTMLQVLVSIQGLILNTKPYFNEPGHAGFSGTLYVEKSSLEYNENILILSLKTMVYTMNNPPKNFENLVVEHFRNRVRDILMACKAYTEGVQVGSLVTGAAQDVEEHNESCSAKFRNNVVEYIKTLISAFKNIGAQGADEFLSISEKKVPLPASASAPVPAHYYGYSPFPFPLGPGYNKW